MVRPTVHSVKHFHQETLSTVASGAIGVRTLAHAVNVRSATDTDVAEGAQIKAVFIEMWVTTDDATQGSAVISLEKVQANNTAMAYGESLALHDYDNKRNIFYITQGLVPPNIQSGIPFLRGWFKIPKGKQRFALGDTLYLNITAPSNGLVLCGVILFKEYY